jgi:DNA repair protein RadA/Sms
MQVLNAIPAQSAKAEVVAKLNGHHRADAEKPRGEKPPLVVRRLADVAPETVEWLWHPYIPLGKLTLLEGDPGLGKSWITCALATAVAAGHGLPGQEPSAPRNVLMMSAEDGLADTIRPRLDSMRADVSRIFALETPVTLDERGLLSIAEVIAKYEPALVIVDPLVAYMGGDVDIHRANETREVMAELARLAAQFRCAILCVRHLTKGGGTKAISRGLGSIDIIAACRSALLVGADPDEQSKRGIVHIKSNLAPVGQAVGYALTADGFFWSGQSDLTAERILSLGAGDEPASRREAEEFLNDMLATCSRSAREIQREAREAGISDATLRRAKDALGIRSRKIGQPGGRQEWHWEMPEDAQPTEDAHTFGGEHLREGDDSKPNCSNDLPEDAHLKMPEHLRPSEDAQRDAGEHLRVSGSRKEGYGDGNPEDAHLKVCEHLRAEGEHLREVEHLRENEREAIEL